MFNNSHNSKIAYMDELKFQQENIWEDKFREDRENGSYKLKASRALEHTNTKLQVRPGSL